MPIVGWSLDKIRKDVLNGAQFSKQTAIKICVQTLNAVRDLHDIGFLHRDLKLANFAIGIDKPSHETIFMSDLGIAKRIVGDDGIIPEPREKVAFLETRRYASRACHQMKEQDRKDDVESCDRDLVFCREPREKVAFLETRRYASRACHQMKEQDRKNDVESWCYIVLDIFDGKCIPWRELIENDETFRMKVMNLGVIHDDLVVDPSTNAFRMISCIAETIYLLMVILSQKDDLMHSRDDLSTDGDLKPESEGKIFVIFFSYCNYLGI
ncbi:hypothetical protein DICVIV_12795 [Dictyocaulus viviparus]|uniref:Protein kinase domain-containing protein n=1 Tax=Dictyocaulus viviparus TaxID=29172 RepID=A0A0D8XFV5_DICVI|nr:hypothetical protein DICVIV_12795 [Dictyocaulus viviparus]